MRPVTIIHREFIRRALVACRSCLTDAVAVAVLSVGALVGAAESGAEQQAQARVAAAQATAKIEIARLEVRNTGMLADAAPTSARRSAE